MNNKLEIIDFIKAERDSLENTSGISFSQEILKIILNNFELDTFEKNDEIEELIKNYGKYFLYSSLENVFSKEENEIYRKYILFFYNAALLFDIETAKRDLELANKIFGSSYSFFEQIEVMKAILNSMNRNIMSSKVEFEASPHFLKIIRGEKND